LKDLDIKVSILIPLYNSERFIASVIDSAVKQTWVNKEIIIVDDGSEDNSLEFANKFKAENVRIYSQKNSGASSARNRAFKESTGQYIQYLDSDDILAPDKIENQLLQLKCDLPGTIASGPFCNFTGSIENFRTPVKDDGYSSYDNPVDWLLIAAFDKAMFPTVVWLTPRKLIEEAGPWNEGLTYNDDSEFFARVLLKSNKIVFCENAVSYYRRGNPNSLGSQKSYIARKSEFDSLKLVTEHLIQFEDSERVRRACSYRLNKLYYSLYPSSRTIRTEIKDKLIKLRSYEEFEFGNGFTSKIGRLIGWKMARWLRYYILKIIKLRYIV
jgi:glycosyltransferase involved in cell wall biosynthesis